MLISMVRGIIKRRLKFKIQNYLLKSTTLINLKIIIDNLTCVAEHNIHNHALFL